MATLTVVSYTATTVTLLAEGLAVGDTVEILGRAVDDYTTYAISDTYTASATSVKKTYSGLAPSTEYIVNIRVNGEWFYSSVSSTGLPYPPSWTTKATTDRPWSWAWYSTIVQGGKIGLTAVEWNDFCFRINEFRVYKDLSECSFTTVSSGTVISAAICNEAWTAINEITGHGTMPSKATVGGTITASFFTGLCDALNAIT